MALSPLGIFSSAGAGQIIPDFEWIATANGTGSSGVITFSSLPTEFTHLQIRYVAKSSTTGDGINVRINGSTGTYTRHSLFGQSTTASSGNGTGLSELQLPNSLETSTNAGRVSGGIIEIMDYKSTTKNKTIKALYGRTNPFSVFHTTGSLFNTAAVTTITLTANTGNFSTLSRFAIYGWKG